MQTFIRIPTCGSQELMKSGVVGVHFAALHADTVQALETRSDHIRDDN